MSDATEVEKAKLAAPVSWWGRLLPGAPDRTALLLLLLAVLGVYGDLLLAGGDRILSHRIGDGAKYFVFAREFGYGELLRGNLALWNPHLFSGTPFVGVFQPAMLYPPNLFYLALPLPVAFNLEIVLHVLLLGATTYAWARGRGLQPGAGFTTAVIVALGASTALRVLAGQLTVLDTYAWVPLLLRSIDELARRPGPGWTLVGCAATTMIVLAGHPPTAFMSAMVVGVYCIPALRASGERGRLLLSLVFLVLTALLLASVQLALGLEAAQESIRDRGMSFDFVTSFSLPPESLLGLGVPNLFGKASAQTVSYYGRWWYWDDLVFIGMSATLLAVVGAVRGRGNGHRSALVLAGLLCVVAMGRYTPLYGLLYEWVPGFDSVRSPSKFMFFSSLFVALLAGMGLERLLEDPADERAAGAGDRRLVAATLAVLALVLFGLAWWAGEPEGRATGWSTPVRLLAELNERHDFGPKKLAGWSEIAAHGLRNAGLVTVALAVLFWLSGRHRRATWLIVALALLELVAFARSNRGGVPVDIHARNRPEARALYERAGDRRVLERHRTSNLAMQLGGLNLWGYDPLVLDRYAHFMARAQSRPLERLNNIEGNHPNRHDPLLGLVRGRFAVGKQGKLYEYPGELPRFLLVGRHRVLEEPSDILDALQSEGFDPHEIVILEHEPIPVPAGRDVEGEVRLLEESTDHLLLDVEVDAPAILVVTDSYARGWRVTGQGSRYRVEPANLVLRSIALEAGHHRLRLEYAPGAYHVGRVLFAAGVALFLAASLYWRRGCGAKRGAVGGEAG